MWKKMLFAVARKGIKFILSDEDLLGDVKKRAANLNKAIDIPVLTEEQEQAIFENVIQALKGVVEKL